MAPCNCSAKRECMWCREAREQREMAEISRDPPRELAITELSTGKTTRYVIPKARVRRAGRRP